MLSGDLVTLSEVAKISAGLDTKRDYFGIIINRIDFGVLSGMDEISQNCYEVLLKGGMVEIFHEEDLEIVK